MSYVAAQLIENRLMDYRVAARGAGWRTFNSSDPTPLYCANGFGRQWKLMPVALDCSFERKSAKRPGTVENRTSGKRLKVAFTGVKGGVDKMMKCLMVSSLVTVNGAHIATESKYQPCCAELTFQVRWMSDC
jgi:hypothetical protein